MRKSLQWKLAYSDAKNGELSPWVPATVPGCVQLDMAAALQMPLYFTGDHEEEYRWMEDKYWHYRSQQYIEDNAFVPFLHFNGVEYEYEVLIDGVCKLYHEGMFTQTEVALTEYRGKEICIDVVIYPAPKVKGCVYERGLGNEAAQSCKPAFSYGWDWCPRFVTLGIYDEAYVDYRPATRITDLQVSYRLDETFRKANITIDYAVSAAGSLQCILSEADGTVVLEKTVVADADSVVLGFEDPKLWWPCNHGEQPVYTLKTNLIVDGEVTDTRVRRIGFRRMRLVANDNVWAEQVAEEMMTCTRPPMTLEVNGRRIFAKGSNWVPPEMCRAQMKKDHIEQLLDLLLDANMNIIRMWGGGYIHPEWFYDMCDEKGILVWQEFPLACAEYRDNDRYLAVLKQETEAIIKQLRTHPCLALWSGGNELFTDWSRMTPQHKAVRLMDAQTYTLDPENPFIYTSPQQGVAHGSYEMLCKTGRETLTEFCMGRFTAYTEFGCGAPSEMDYIKTFMTEEEIARPFEAPIWEKRHARLTKPVPRWFDAAGIQKLTGCSGQLQDLLKFGNEAQKVMYSSMFEEVRRQWPHASMALNWCFNEPWPTAAGNGLVNYPALPRPSYASVKEALKGQKFSLRYSRIAWRPGEQMELSAWVLNDTAQKIPAGQAVVSVIADGIEQCLDQWEFAETGAWTNQSGVVFTVKIPKTIDGRLTLKMTSHTHPHLNAQYSLFVHENAI